MSTDDNEDIRPRPEIWEKGIVVLAALLTLAGAGAVYFMSIVPPTKSPPPPAQVAAPASPGEVTVGIYPSKSAH